jgi:endonuclease YncB( thermonuclease family)
VKRAALALCFAAAAGAACALEGVVTRVSDGDTLWLRPAGGGRYVKVRVQGIDAPELCQAWGLEAKRALEALALGQRVHIDDGALRDDHGRRLSRLLRDGEDLGARMVRDGHAWSYRWRRDAGPYLIEEVDARTSGRGLHADPQAIVPREFRKRHGPCPPA